MPHRILYLLFLALGWAVPAHAQDAEPVIDVNTPWIDNGDPSNYFWDSRGDFAWYYYASSPMLLPSVAQRGDFSVGGALTGGGGFVAQGVVRPWRNVVAGGGYTQRWASAYTRVRSGEAMAGAIWTGPWHVVVSAMLGYGQGDVHNRYPAFGRTPEPTSRLLYRAGLAQAAVSVQLWGAVRIEGGVRATAMRFYGGHYDALLPLQAYGEVKAVERQPAQTYCDWNITAGLRLWCAEVRLGWQHDVVAPFDPAFAALQRTGTLGLQFNLHDLRPYLEREEQD